MSNLSEQKSFPFISPIKSNPKIPNESLFKTPIKANSFSIDNKHHKHQTIPYTLSTTEQSSFLSGMHNKHNNSLLSSPYKHLTSIRYKMYSKLQTLEEKEKQQASLSSEQNKSQKQLVNKFIESRRNVSLIKPPFDDSHRCSSEKKLSKKVDFRKNLIRDYTGESKFVNFEQKINRAKEYYYKQVELIQKSQKTKQKEINKIIEELEARKVNNIITNISLIKETFREDINKYKKPIDYNKLENIAMNALKMYFNKKMKLKKDIAKQITNEIQNMDAKPYEKLFNKKGIPLKQGQVFNEINLERKIKLHNINHSMFDPHNDDLCEKNPKKLKHNMSSINLGITKYLKGHCPRNVKKTFKNATLGKFAGLNGVYFSMS